MIPEEQIKPANRFLYAQTFLSDKTIRKWQKRAKERCSGKKIMEVPYGNFINWRRSENEIAVFTMYAYADFQIPKSYDCIFDYHAPEQNMYAKFVLSQSICEGWFPVGFIECKHKHLCILTFENDVPSIFHKLIEEEAYNGSSKSNKPLGICDSNILPALLSDRRHQQLLRKKYGDDWHKYYEG